MRRRLLPLVLLVALPACASAGARYRAAAAVETFGSALVQAQMVVMDAYASQQISQAQYLRWQGAFLALAQQGKVLTAVLRKADEGRALDTVLASITALLQGELAALPSDVRPAMRISLETLRTSALLMAVAAGG